MSKDQDNLEDKLSDAKAMARDMLNKRKRHNTQAIEVAKTGSTKDMVLWLIAIIALISATLVNQYLPGYWQPASDIWVRIGIISLLIILALACLAITHQGKAFKILLEDSAIELKRVTWPSKNETIQYTWQVILVMIIVGFMVWVLDNIFNWIIGLLIN